ncbi:50S ribosomal protein L28 [Candidatus Annandia adelgestsuga]|uniref:Large ribosomal subunit protein bL28 n=1 Tax=Candidatus Annandia adelgestsuga TaxID=1302411 RepID=A0A3S9J787_9ENTR|nr:50S ribosomal protein L28 [Candidatus Annandia adelgestsuga]AZP36139.1 50S ribosomal protein L28 [Candidatus Annandia adelgestsuga]
MSKICFITGKKTIFGNNRSHSMNATKRHFFPNIHIRKLWISKLKKFVKFKISSKGIRIIDKKGFEILKKKIYINRKNKIKVKYGKKK